MTDENAAPVSAPANALAVQELTEDVGHLKKQIKGLWIAVIAALVLVVLLAALTLLPRLLGFGLIGGRGFRPGGGGGFSPNGQQQQQQQPTAPTAP